MEETDEVPRCSRKGCRAPAVYAVVWNNPKLHTPDREKVWLACEEHVESHRSFLGVRSMLRYVETLAERTARVGDPSAIK
ncbi:MAG: hypothetical protein ABI912_00795 [Actinomycetota bacterium]